MSLLLIFSTVVLGEEINKIEVIEKSIEENTDKYEIKVKYPSITQIKTNTNNCFSST